MERLATMQNLTLGQAAKLTGKSKSTISRAIKTGRLSASKEGGTFKIAVSELTRVFDATVAQPDQKNDTQPHPNTASAPEVEIRMLREMLERERETVDDLRGRLTRAETLLTDQREKTAEPPKRGFWARLVR